jgi:aryl-alcohol dehydrogenase-like predicted oxidoreductase
MQAIADLRGWSPFVALQIPYNLTQRRVERELIPMAREMGMGVLPWSPLAGGVLSGKYDRGDLDAGAPASIGAAGSRRDINLATGRLTARNLEIARVVGEVAAELGATSSQVALAWTMLDPAITSPLIGARTLPQLEDNLGALDLTFNDEQIARLDVVSRIEMGFPHDFLTPASTDMMLGGVTIERR